MFAKTIIDSDAFLDMPLSTQSLYFHLSMRADDDGFINNPKKIQRMVGCGDDDLKLLMAKRFILVFDSGVIVIKHWKIHNYIRNDRYKPTLYQEEKAELAEKNSKAYTFKTEAIESENHLGIPDDNRMGYQMDTQVRLGKDRLVKDKKKNSVEPSSTMPELFEKVWKTYPKKTNKKKAREQFLKKFKTEEDLESFKKGYKDYLAYIKLNDWYHPQELFRWIRDDRYNDEYDLSQTNKQPAYSKAPVRQEQLPNWNGMQEDVPLSPEELAELERQKQELLGE
ncbi:TPA: DNA replication protein [Enterococcus faecalis]|uniref:DNA replication protein n=1 Tax=Enterococcus faecalis TaxID=1351 RepID=UPI00164EEE40|nr:DNA replication protein [Enterococcus faecalis]HBI1657441.1 DNA replication protein [Enterococcus faecalis]HBI1660439.1 DNA replication protein [Enterococcus faecalis]HBI1666321.1 DNA replication protein [Enterococcus faecalis]HBI1669414.1 DNA replication protein [Enterococcus faecalis]HBI1672504.1 DNA replication protein [Enterococcus faecalis]